MVMVMYLVKVRISVQRDVTVSGLTLIVTNTEALHWAQSASGYSCRQYRRLVEPSVEQSFKSQMKTRLNKITTVLSVLLLTSKVPWKSHESGFSNPSLLCASSLRMKPGLFYQYTSIPVEAKKLQNVLSPSCPLPHLCSLSLLFFIPIWITCKWMLMFKHLWLNIFLS